MLNIYKSSNSKIVELENFEPGCWINLIAPTDDEVQQVCQATGALPELVRAALDEEERSRIEHEEEEHQTLILVDIPRVEKEGDSFVYTTIPFGIVHCEEYIITICLISSHLVRDFLDGRIRGLYTAKKTRFIFQFLLQNAGRYLNYLRQIDAASNRVQAEMQKSYRNKELLQMMALEKSLVYFSTSLKSNELVLEKLLRVEFIKKYPDDEDILEDVIIENKQAIEMCAIYRDILSGTMDAYASIISNNLNIVMKLLAALTIVLAIPALFAAYWGMNVPVPFEGNPYGFWIVLGISLLGTLGTFIFLWRKKMF